MARNRQLIIFIALFFLSVSNAFPSENNKIYVTPNKYSDNEPYYHIKYTLAPENTVLKVERYYQGKPFDYASLQENGFFEVYIRKDKFPIKAPGCNSKYLFLQMKGSELPSHITEKKELYNRIKKMVETGKGSVDVIIELNPYSIVKKKDPLEIELEGCNIWFREAYGRYISYLGPLRK
jgi:hypothetical protein